MKPKLLALPQWKFYFTLGFAPFLFALLMFAKAVGNTSASGLETVYAWVMMLALIVGRAIIDLGTCIRFTNQSQASLEGRIHAQDERIRQLEAQVAALTHRSTTP